MNGDGFGPGIDSPHARPDPGLARRVRDLIAPTDVHLDTTWGLDHGTWSVLCHVFLGADVPVVQLSIDERQPSSFHYEMGRRLALLREEGGPIVGSGNIVHNLHACAWGRHGVEPFDWAVRFETRARELLVEGDHASLIAYDRLGPDAMLSLPTPEQDVQVLREIVQRFEGTICLNARVLRPARVAVGNIVELLSA